ncbi:aminotransferase class IV [Solicola gregarius]|uniref:Aminotransferase class IV n=1 Tax=Solicola gregarius TaxID=2908642 RepID=A0AA46TE89_9ACTN|nr:aminotransferase class IV [Solicola gregarius]UYM03426.1 aminotransferase class IV [Solicola gregarius]
MSETRADADFARGAAYVDGEVVPVDQARIPLLDTGLTRSDVTYDVVGVWGGAFFRLDDHLDRFLRGCERLRMTVPLDRSEITELLDRLVRASGLREAYVEVMCTRGVPTSGSRDPRTYDNRLYAYAIPYVWILRPEEEAGMDAVVVRSTRRIPPDSVDPTVKNFHWGDLTRGLFEAYDRGGRYPILLDHRGFVTEGPGYNVFAVVDGALVTPAVGVLEGITRRTVLELAAEHGLSTTIDDLEEPTLRQASELFATSTAGGVMAITSVDDSPVGDGRVGHVTANLRDAYWKAHSDQRYVTPVDYASRTQ